VSGGDGALAGRAIIPVGQRPANRRNDGNSGHMRETINAVTVVNEIPHRYIDMLIITVITRGNE
jgi:hypothetical protein